MTSELLPAHNSERRDKNKQKRDRQDYTLNKQKGVLNYCKNWTTILFAINSLSMLYSYSMISQFALLHGSHYILVLKFKDPEVAFSRTNSRRKFTAWAVLKQYLISISVITGPF